ncbi:hypothetical protein AB2M62_07620 [Sphingomonas sp. MMS12-HWE2-04]|uniref:hypothetical protein n=1 Tax=Sphingomonas sp. MMS12-HWE2-04 TaxID=3234199 RepID=UPI00384CCB29
MEKAILAQMGARRLAMPFDQLFIRHGRILRNLETFEMLVAGAHPAQVDGLADHRWAFTRDLLIHFAEMELNVFGPMMRDSRIEAQQQAAAASAATSALVRDFREHVARWHGFPKADQWDTYRRAILQLTQRIRARIDAEAVDILPLLPAQPEGGGPRNTGESYAAEAWKIRGVIYSMHHKPIVERIDSFDEDAA